MAGHGEGSIEPRGRKDPPLSQESLGGQASTARCVGERAGGQARVVDPRSWEQQEEVGHVRAEPAHRLGGPPAGKVRCVVSCRLHGVHWRVIRAWGGDPRAAMWRMELWRSRGDEGVGGALDQGSGGGKGRKVAGREDRYS